MTLSYRLERELATDTAIGQLQFSPDGERLALLTSDKNNSVRLLRSQDLAPVPAPRFIRNDLAFAGDGALFVAGKTVHRHELGEAGPGKPTLAIEGEKKGLTRIAAAPDGRWLALHKYLDVLELWYVGDPNPTKRATVRASALVDLGFRPDSAQLWFTSRVSSPLFLQTIDLEPGGGNLQPTPPQPLPSVFVYSPVRAAPRGLVAISDDLGDVVLLEWGTWAARPLGLRALWGERLPEELVVAGDGSHVAAVARDPDNRLRLRAAALDGDGEPFTFRPEGSATGLAVALTTDGARLAVATRAAASKLYMFART
ncbi:WD40 repeat domain-containing protein [Nannocystis pusilla]|uniref:WD40 repeat domain-containing protein n=1 Tax=Nannocystis pusilla TaxID=889268 RepID=UPI003BF235C0